MKKLLDWYSTNKIILIICLFSILFSIYTLKSGQVYMDTCNNHWVSQANRMYPAVKERFVLYNETYGPMNIIYNITGAP